MHLIELRGCAPAPLGHYLKALGIFRLVAEQKDPQVRACWRGNAFRILTSLTEDELVAFFLNEYAPTPLLSPWNGGSGFFVENDKGLAPTQKSKGDRFAALRRGIVAARATSKDFVAAGLEIDRIKALSTGKGLSKEQKAALKGNKAAIKEENKEKLKAAENQYADLKVPLLQKVRREWRGPEQNWALAAMVLDGDGLAKFPSVFGSGGNDGNFDFTNNFLQRLGEVYDLTSELGVAAAESKSLLQAALLGTLVLGLNKKAPVGQFMPGNAGGANQANGPDSDGLVNPFDFIFALEGALVLVPSASKRMGENKLVRGAAPFAVAAVAAGYGTAAQSDEDARGEQWFPLWEGPASMAEVRRMFAEGRAQLGRRTAREPLDFVRAATTLGAARGITAFQRFGFIERNGQSKIAVPLGVISVSGAPQADSRCVDDVERWVANLRRSSRADHAAARLVHAAKYVEENLISCIAHPGESSRWQACLMALADAEGAVALAAPGVGPLPRLRIAWAQLANDNSPEFRLALTFAMQSGDPRQNWLPIRKGRLETGGAETKRLARNGNMVIHGRDGLADALAFAARRFLMAGKSGSRFPTTLAGFKAGAAPHDLGELVAGRVDLDRTMTLARALMALDRGAWNERPLGMVRPSTFEMPDEAWMAIRLATLPYGKLEPVIRPKPAIIRRLAAGDAPAAVDLALQALRSSGIRTAVRSAIVTPAAARLWGAALAFPISQNTAQHFINHLQVARQEQGVRP